MTNKKYHVTAMLLVVVPCTLGACFDPTIPRNVECGPEGQCPPETECFSNGVCYDPAVLATCGDGDIDSNGEVCDDGNTDNGDTCAADCRTGCGDGTVNGSEVCDDAGESATCDADCTAAACGDGTTNPSAGEACDDGAANTANCDSDCTAAVCGDGYVNIMAGESCDGSLSCNPNDCTILRSCLDWLNAGLAAGDGVYWIDAGTGEISVFCDMSSDGGGWTAIMRVYDNIFTYDDNVWTTSVTLNAADFNFTSPGKAKYESFNAVAFTTIRTSDTDNFGINHKYTFDSQQASALTVFSAPGFQLDTTLVNYFNDRVDANFKQWGCTDYIDYGFNQQDYLGTAFLLGGGDCDWNGGARWGQRVNAYHGGMGNHTGQGWGAYTTISISPPTQWQVLWVR